MAKNEEGSLLNILVSEGKGTSQLEMNSATHQNGKTIPHWRVQSV